MPTTSTPSEQPPTGRFVTRNGRRLYEIDGVDRMPPFLMTVVGDTDLWLYLSSSGGLTGGRVEPARCLFPYETDDRLHHAAGITGPITRVRLPDGSLWCPFDSRPLAPGRVRRLLRTSVGDAVVFEEQDGASGLTFSAEWTLSDTHGLIRRCELRLDDTSEPTRVELLDGLLNIMPANVELPAQQASSTLVDAYKRAELDPETELAIFALEAAIWDRPEARESLRANVVWRSGLNDALVTLDPGAVRAFELDHPLDVATVSTGRRGAYFCRAAMDLEPGGRERWCFAADAHLDHAAVVRRRTWLKNTDERAAAIDADLASGAERLAALLDRADGSQCCADESVTAAHRSNVLFNAMRGGVPSDEYAVDVSDFRRFVHTRHGAIAARHDGFIASLGERVSMPDLHRAAAERGDPQLERLAFEYLPLTFGRRHGDPSRPWNRFRIRMRDAAGRRALGYEGNWRDIFQNWEAVCRSYPLMLPGVIAKFVNASTTDGQNPYRISESGIDWEVPEPDNPWATIGYWGDHQLIYLLRLLEQLRDTDPDALRGMLDRRIFSYADVPYVIKSFDELVRDPKASIRFDQPRHDRIVAREREVGADARLVSGDDGEPVLVSLVEKLLVTVLGKVANLVPDGGVWMNTQRPEWNDANNALAGFGLSMVTLYQLRRFVDFGVRLLESHESEEIHVSAAVGQWCEQTLAALVADLQAFETGDRVDDGPRWRVLEALGRAADRARERIRRDGLGESTSYPLRAITDLFRLTRFVCDHAIRSARRDDGLYDSYNVVHFDARAARARVERLHLMLEGQVSLLASGVLEPTEALALLEKLFESDLYREDQRTFILYPHIERPAFLDRNAVPDSAVEASPLLQAAVRDGLYALAVRDEDGRVRFNAELVGVRELNNLVGKLVDDPNWSGVVAEDGGAVRAAYEATFHHARFTGRSGTMHKYEGIGSVYWHMVSKLLLGALEEAVDARRSGTDERTADALMRAYGRVRDGLGMRKTPAEFGAVPHEPYSHTPWHLGAQQPGMTGQVKEGVLARLTELGVLLREGQIHFEPTPIIADELLTAPTDWRLRGVSDRTLSVPAGAIGFSVCGTPVILAKASASSIRLHVDGGPAEEIAGTALTQEWSRELFNRTGRVHLIEVFSDRLG